MLVWVAGFEPAASCVQGRPSTRLTVHPAKIIGAPGESRTPRIPLLRRARMPVPSPGRGSKMKKALSISVVPSRDGPRAACARPVDIAAQGGSLSPAHPARPSTLLSSGGGAKAHPKWLLSEPQAGSLRRCHVRPGPAASCERALTACGTITAGTENQKNKAKQKGPEPCGARASAKRAWKGMRLRAPSTRWPTIPIVRMCTQTSRQTRQQAQDGTRCTHSGAHEHAARCGSTAGEGGGGVHGESWRKGGQSVEMEYGRNRDGGECKESLLRSQHPGEENFLGNRRFQRVVTVPSRSCSTRATKSA